MFKTKWYKKRFKDINEVFFNFQEETVCVFLKNGDYGIAKTELGDKFSADYGVLMALLKAREVATKNTATFTFDFKAGNDAVDSFRMAI